MTVVAPGEGNELGGWGQEGNGRVLNLMFTILYRLSLVPYKYITYSESIP